MTDQPFNQTPSDGTLASELSPRRRGRPAQFSPEERAERAKQSAKAQKLASSVLRERHAAEYDDLYEKAKAEVGLS